MNVYYLIPPKKFPSSIVDPGVWWDVLSQSEDIDLTYCNLNYKWWKYILSPKIKDDLYATMPMWRKFVNVFLQHKLNNIEESGAKCIDSLEQLKELSTYYNLDKYSKAINVLSDHINNITSVNQQLVLKLFQGVIAQNMNYQNSKSYYDYANKENLLFRTIKGALQDEKINADVLLVSVEEEYDLLTAMSAIHVIKKSNPNIYICLIEHSKENFSLIPYKENLLKDKWLFYFFDSIIEGRENRDEVVCYLIEALKKGRYPKLFITPDDFMDEENKLETEKIDLNKSVSLPVDEIFSCKRVLFTRAHNRRCYWGKCSFCTQRLKYATNVYNNNFNVELTAERYIHYSKQGFEIINIADEALPPSFLIPFCNYLIEKNAHFKWSCLLRLDSFYKDLFPLMKKAGCYETVYGFESINQRILKLMRKYPQEVSKDSISQLLHSANDAGIGVYISIIRGFPSESFDEFSETIDFVIKTLMHMKNTTFIINNFQLIYGSEVANNPQKFGIIVNKLQGDMPHKLSYTYEQNYRKNQQKIHDHSSKLYDDPFQKLGWENILNDKEKQLAFWMYIITAQGSIFKTIETNVFDEEREVHCEQSRIDKTIQD